MHSPTKLTSRDVKGSSCGPSRGTILAFGWRDLRRTTKTSVMIASVPEKTEVGTSRIQVRIPLQPTNMLQICIRATNYLISKI